MSPQHPRLADAHALTPNETPTMPKSKVESWLDEMERDAAEPESRAAQTDFALLPSGEEALSVLWSPEPAALGRRQSVEEVLLANGKLEPDKLLQARSVQSTSRGVPDRYSAISTIGVASVSMLHLSPWFGVNGQ